MVTHLIRTRKLKNWVLSETFLFSQFEFSFLLFKSSKNMVKPRGREEKKEEGIGRWMDDGWMGEWMNG